MNYHKCEVTDCKAQIPEQHLMCPPHWRKVPRHIQNVIVTSNQMRNQNYYSAIELARQAATNTQAASYRDLFSPLGSKPAVDVRTHRGTQLSRYPRRPNYSRRVG